MSLAAASTDVAPAAAASCVHCGATLGPGQESFCCGGCAAAYGFIQQLGLGRYYAGRALDPAQRPPRPPSDSAGDAACHAVAAADGSAALNLAVDGLHCAACVWLIEQALARDPAVISARVNLTSRRLALRWTGKVEEAARLVGIVERLGYRVVPFDAVAPQGLSGEERELLKAMAVAGFAAANVMLLSVAVWSGGGEMGPATRDLMHWVSALIALPAIAYAGRPFFRSAWAALRAWRTNMDVPISIGVVCASGLSLWETARSQPHAYFESAAMLLFFLLVGRALDRRARGRARSAAEHLVALSAAPVTVLAADGTAHAVPASSLRRGDTVLVAQGERIGVDGVVTTGRSSVDKSLIDGESLPEAIGPESAVLAGMTNLSGPIRVTVSEVGQGTFLAEVARLMEAAERGRARLVVLADRVARFYAPAVHVLALATFAIWAAVGPWQQALLNAVAVLIITCPCALGLAVPVVQVIGSNRLFARGILLKSATALERLAQIDTVVFDKTGTLTLGRPELIPDPALPEDGLREAAAMAAASRHPLSRALCRAMPDVPPAEAVTEVPGAGLRRESPAGTIRLGSRAFCGVPADDGAAAAEAELWLLRPGMPAVRFAFADRLRPDAAATIARLERLGKRVMLLSGDRAPAVAAVAQELAIAEWRAGVGPEAKCASLAEMAAKGSRAFMIGDGLNDAAALAAAHVSMSPASAADLSQTAADVVFQGDSLGAVTEVLAVARRGGRLVIQNIGLAILYNLVAVPVAMLGYATPIVAAAAMSGSSMIVVANALRLGRARR
jgi:P-type Cu2+ transporter